MNAAEDARRRSTRLHPQIRASEAGQGVTHRRTTRLHPHPQIHASDGVTRRRSPRLHPYPQVHAMDEGDGVAQRRSARLRPQVHPSAEASRVTRSSPLEVDDLLWEILLRLPPEPSSLPRASAVCKQWRCVAIDPRFHGRFCAHHRKPPLLGFFKPIEKDGIVFTPVLDPPNRIAPQSFHMPLLGVGVSKRYRQLWTLWCGHGRLLILPWEQEELIVIAPITGQEHRVQVPPEFKSLFYFKGAVLCAAADHNHVHGSCPFKVILLSPGSCIPDEHYAFARVYYSETGIWSQVISTPTPCHISAHRDQGSLVGNALYWPCKDYIVQFDLEGQSIALIAPPIIKNDPLFDTHVIIETGDGALGLAILSKYYYNIQVWQREVICQGVAKWVLWKTIDMHTIHRIRWPKMTCEMSCGLRYAEDTDEIFLHLGNCVYVLQLKSMQSKKLCQIHHFKGCHPFKSFCMPGTAIACGHDGAEMLHDT